MAHKGIREFSGEELSGIALGQNGFKLITNATVTCGSGGTAGYTDIEYFVALKAVDVDAEVEARSYITNSDDLTISTDGEAKFGGSHEVTILNGDIVYGAFDKVKVDSGKFIIAYIGR